MKLIINSGSTYKGGSEQVALSFIHECKNYPEHQFHVVIGKNLARQTDLASFPENFSFHILENRPATGIFTFFKTMLWFRRLEKKVEPDCVIATGGHGYWRPQAPLVAGFNIPHYLYPESPYFSRISLKKRIFWKTKKLIDLFFFNRVDAYLVQTEDVNERVKKLLGSKHVYTVSNTVNGHFFNFKEFSNKIPEKENDEIRLLTLSSYYPHKNMGIINEIATKLTDLDISNFKFVLTIPDDVFESEFNDLAKNFIYNIGPIPIEECPSLYKEIDFMFLPTLLECFSASYAEAMVMEKPILTSDLGFAHTVCGDAAVYFDPLDPDDIIEKIIDLSKSKAYQDKLVKIGSERVKKLNTPASRAEKFLAICKDISTGEKKY